ncbi:hypothetical protein WA158_002170 [Blastocystis sp. Blastoise]
MSQMLFGGVKPSDSDDHKSKNPFSESNRFSSFASLSFSSDPLKSNVETPSLEKKTDDQQSLSQKNTHSNDDPVMATKRTRVHALDYFDEVELSSDDSNTNTALSEKGASSNKSEEANPSMDISSSLLFHHSSSHHHSHHHHHHRSSSSNIKVSSSNNNLSPSEEQSTENPTFEKDQFCYDRQGDKDNIILESLYSQIIPIYKQTQFLITPDAIIHYKKGMKSIRYFEQQNMNERSRLFAYDYQRINNKRRNNNTNIEFIPLGTDPLSKEFYTESVLNKEEQESFLYNDLEKQLRDNQKDINNYIRIIQHISSTNTNSKQQQINNIDRCIYILEKGLEQLPENQTLLYMYCNLLTKIPDHDLSESKFQQLTERYSHIYNVWLYYIQFKLSYCTEFNVEVLYSLFTSCLESLMDYRNTLARQGSPQDIIDSYTHNIISIIYYYSLVLKEKGYMYKGLLLLQSLLEFNIHIPEVCLGKSNTVKQQLFEVYLYKCPLMGNDNYIYWDTYIYEEQQKRGSSASSPPIHTSIIPSLSSIYFPASVYDDHYDIPLCIWPENTENRGNLPSIYDIEDNQEMNQEKKEEEEEGIQYVYSSVHGYRIPMPVDVNKNINTIYKNILQELNDIQVEKELEDVNTLKYNYISDNDPLYKYSENNNNENNNSENNNNNEDNNMIASNDKNYSANHNSSNNDTTTNDNNDNSKEYTDDDEINDNQEEEEEEEDFIDFDSFKSFVIPIQEPLQYTLFLLLLSYMGIYTPTLSIYTIYNYVFTHTTSDNDTYTFISPSSPLLPSIELYQQPIYISKNILENPDKQRFARNLLLEGINQFPNSSSLYIYHIYFEAILAKNSMDTSYISSILPLMKKYLQLFRNKPEDLYIYEYYIEICMYLGKTKDAEMIYTAMCKLKQRLDMNKQIHIISLFYRYILIQLNNTTPQTIYTHFDIYKEVYTCWMDEDIKKCQWLLSQYTNNIYIYNPNIHIEDKDIQKSLMIYKELMKSEALRIKGNVYKDIYVNVPYVYISYCHALLAYLSYGIFAFIEAMDYSLSLLTENDIIPATPIVYSLHLFKLYYIYRHSILPSLSSFYIPHALPSPHYLPPEILRKHCKLAIRDIPGNSIFLAILIRHDSESIFMGPLSTYMSLYLRSLSTPLFPPLSRPDPTSLYTYIYYYIYLLSYRQRKYHIHLLSPHYMRDLYENLFQSLDATHSPLLWRSYICFEYFNGNYKRAKRVFYRAINKCPWSKMIWKDSIKFLRHILPFEEISQIISYGKEKDILFFNDIDSRDDL